MQSKRKGRIIIYIFRIRIFTDKLELIAILEHHYQTVNSVKLQTITGCLVIFAASADGTISLWPVEEEKIPECFTKFFDIY